MLGIVVLAGLDSSASVVGQWGLAAGKAETYSDVMTWFYGGSLAGGKTNRFLEGVQVEPALN